MIDRNRSKPCYTKAMTKYIHSIRPYLEQAPLSQEQAVAWLKNYHHPDHHELFKKYAIKIGLGPKFNFAFLKSIIARKVLPGFSFKIGGPTWLGYIGYAKKK